MRQVQVAHALVAWVIVAPFAARAADDASASDKRIRRVAVLPLVDFVRTPDSLWLDNTPQPRPPVENALQGYLVQRLALEPRIHVVTPADVVNAAASSKAYRDSAVLGAQHMKLGLDLYRDLRVEDAIGNLEQAYVTLKDAWQDVVDPRVMAELLKTLALCYLERKDAHKAHVALKEMLFWAPDMKFKKGFYSAAFEDALVSALVDFIATYPREYPLLTPARIEKFAHDIDVDTIVFARLEAREGQPQARQLRVAIYDRHTRNVEFRAGLVTTGAAEDFERIDRFVTRWITCLPDAVVPTTGPPPTRLHLFVDTSAAHAVYIKRTTRGLLNVFGMNLSAELQFTSSLGVFLSVSMMSSIRDEPNLDLLANFTFVRIATGLVFSLRGTWWRASVRLGLLDMQIFGPYATATNAYCKFLGAGSQKCSGVDSLGNESTFGFNAAIGGQFMLPRDLYINVRVGYSVYAYPNNNTANQLNHPISTEVGLGYAF